MLESLDTLVSLIKLPLLTALKSAEQQSGLCCLLRPQQLGANNEDSGQRGKPSRSVDNTFTLNRVGY